MVRKFLPYLDKWEESVHDRPGFMNSQKRMLLSSETLLGLRITGDCMYMKFSIANSFVEFLFTLPEVKGQKMALDVSGGGLGHEHNPTVQDYYKNTESLRVVNSFCRGAVRRASTTSDLIPIA